MALPFQTYGAIGCLIFLTLYLLYRKGLPKPIPGIPYNPEATKSLFGDFPSFSKWHADRGELYSWIVSQAQKHNAPVIQVFMRPFGKPWIVLTDFREAEDLMTRRNKEFGRADIFGELFIPLLPNSHIHLPMNDEWRMHRRLIGDAFTPDFLGQVAAPHMYSVAKSLVDMWKEKHRLAAGRPFYALEDILHSALEIMWASAFGSEIATTRDKTALFRTLKSSDLHPGDRDTPVTFPSAPVSSEFKSIITLTQSVKIAIKSPFPYYHYKFALTFYPSLRSAIKHKNKLVKDRLDQAWQKFSQSTNDEKDGNKTVKSATELFVSREATLARIERRKAVYNTPIIRDELFNFLLAGQDTTAITICWGLKFLTANQHVQNKLRDDFRATYVVEDGELPSVQDIVNANLPYFDATIEEIHRLGGTASINTRVALRDTQILGHHIPKGYDVFMLSQGPSYVYPPIPTDESKRSPTSKEAKDRFGVWDPATVRDFIPERWLTRNKKGEVVFNAFAGPAHPFGAGPRACLGRKFASLELKIIITLLIWQFQLAPVPANLGSFAAEDLMVHSPQKCFMRLADPN